LHRTLGARTLELPFDGTGPGGQAGASHFSCSAVPDLRIPVCQAGPRGLEKLWSPSRKSETVLALRRKHMAHDHGDEYQVKTVHGDGTEELSGWGSEEQIAVTVAAIHRPPGTAFWLLARIVLCPYCLDREQTIVECLLTNIPSPRCSPHDSCYLLRVGSMNRHAVFTEHYHL